MKCSVYIIQSLRNNSFYIGSAVNPTKRLKDHNLGRTIYTKNNRPFRLVFTQEFEDTSKARLIESKIKSWKRRDYIEKIIKDGTIRSV
jgi:putative endonuclease